MKLLASDLHLVGKQLSLCLPLSRGIALESIEYLVLLAHGLIHNIHTIVHNFRSPFPILCHKLTQPPLGKEKRTRGAHQRVLSTHTHRLDPVCYPFHQSLRDLDRGTVRLSDSTSS
jgi:hypothetical protein